MKALLEEEARALLNACRIGRLGCVDNGEPNVVPINYVFEDGTIYSHSLPGRKIEVLRGIPAPAFRSTKSRMISSGAASLHTELRGNSRSE